jgi:predicted ATPase/Tfp pilus assembly protein PilF
MTKQTGGRKPKAEEQLDSKFGSLVRQHYKRKNISNQLLAEATLLDPTLISKMLKGQRTNRANVLAVIGGLAKLGVLDSLAEANALLTAVPGQANLDERLPQEADLIKTFSQQPSFAKPQITSPSTPSTLPHPPHRLLGREREVKEIKTLLSQTHTRLVTLCGVGGVGKTRLALEIAKSLTPNFGAGVYFLALENVNESLGLLTTINATLGVSDVPGQTPLANLINFLQAKEVLLILDNFEQLVDHSLIIAELLQATTKLKILVTSRESLRISFEWQYPLTPFDLPEPKTQNFQDLLNYPVVNLFAERAKAVKPDFSLSLGNIENVVEICRQLDGVPLAIELAAARIKSFEVDTLFSRLNLKFVRGGVRDKPQRHQSLEATIAWSYELLSPDEKLVFISLGMFAGTNLAAVEAVCSDQIIDLEQTCLALVDKSLVKLEADRYVMLQTIHEYAQKQLQESGNQAEWDARFNLYFENLAKTFKKQLEQDNSVAVLELIDLEYNNLKTVLNRSLQAGEINRVFQLCLALDEYWYLKGYSTEGRVYCEQALALVTDKAQKAKLLLIIADLALLQGDYLIGEEQAKISFAIWSELGDLQGLKLSLITLGHVTCATGKFDLAKNYHQQSLQICRETGDRLHIAKNLNTLGLIALQQGDYQLAQQHLEEGLTLARAIRRKSTLSVSLSYLGLLVHIQGQYDLARRYYQEKLTIEKEFGNKRGIAIVLGDLGTIAYEQSDYELAQDYFKESLIIRRELRNNGEIAFCLNGLGNVAYSQKKYQLAQFYYEEALKLYQENNLRRGSLKCLLGLAKTRLIQQDARQAACLCGAITKLVDDMGIKLNPLETKMYGELEAGLRRQLSEAEFNESFSQGEQMDLNVYVKEIFQNPTRPALSEINRHNRSLG